MTEDLYMLAAFTGLATGTLTLAFMALGYLIAKIIKSGKEFFKYDDRY